MISSQLFVVSQIWVIFRIIVEHVRIILKNTKTKFRLNVDVYVETVVMLFSIYFESTDCWIHYKYDDSWLNKHKICDVLLSNFLLLTQTKFTGKFRYFPQLHFLLLIILLAFTVTRLF